MIRSRHNKTVKNMRASARCKDDFALLEGPHLVGEALEAGLELDPVLVGEEADRDPDVAAVVARLPRSPIEVGRDVLASVADASTPRSILALASLPRRGFDPARFPQGPGVYLYLDGIQDPGNLGAIVRVAEASGARGLATSREGAHPNHPRALHASAGSLLRLPVTRAEPDELRRVLPGAQWVALAPRDGVGLWTWEPPPQVVLVLGSEGGGIGSEASGLVDVRVSIPTAGRVESLNVAVAAGIVLFELRRRVDRGTR